MYFIAGKAGSVDIYRYDLATNAVFKITDGQSLFAYPIEQPDGSLLTLLSDFQGNNMHQLAVNLPGKRVNELEQENRSTNAVLQNTAQPIESDTQIVPQVRLPSAKIYSDDDGEMQTYNMWDQTASLALETQYASASMALFNLGVKGSDFLEHLSWHIGGAHDLANGAPQRYICQYSISSR